MTFYRMSTWLGIGARWALLRGIHLLIRRWVLHGDPTVGQAQRRARRWGLRLELRLVIEP